MKNKRGMRKATVGPFVVDIDEDDIEAFVKKYFGVKKEK